MKRTEKQNLLIEIGTEEIPARFLQDSSGIFRSLMVQLFKENRISFNESAVKSLFAPRRLTVFVPDVAPLQQEAAELVKGPPLTVALDERGEWTQAAHSFAARHGVGVSSLIRRKTEKGEYLFVEKKIRGRPTSIVLQETLSEWIQKMSFKKSMRWGEGQFSFARPIRWILALLGAKVIRFKLGMVSSDRTSLGYRWVKNSRVSIPKADLSIYLKLLKTKGVYADASERLSLIKADLERVLGRDRAIHNEDLDLLTEVANLVEFPNVGLGSFDKRYLSLPHPVLTTAMKSHQKYLPVYDKHSGKLLPQFLVVFNGPRKILSTVIRGNERVLQARLADAAFFWDQDRKKSLADRLPDLKHVVFQENLGSYFDKAKRLEGLAQFLGQQLSLEKDILTKLQRSALLCKADLVSEMVGEFPDLQGMMGGQYALTSGEDKDVAQAIEEHYLPTTGSEGELPKTQVGCFLALIDKLDTVVGAFQAGLAPSGSQDPYGLRRLSSGLLRILYEKGVSISLKECIHKGLELYRSGDTFLEPVLKFFQERLENLFLSLGFDHDLVRTVVDRQFQSPFKAYKIIKDLQSAQGKSFFPEAVAVVERTFNILKGGVVEGGEIEEGLLREREEIDLYRTYKSNYDNIIRLIELGDFVKATSEYARVFSEPVHIFFDKVLVNVDDERLRQNRYILLKKIHELYSSRVADLSKISSKG